MITLKIQLFGGRGASLGIKSQIPSPDKASIHDDKIYKYYLNEEKEHYHEFVEAGYTKENGEQLRKDMLDGLKTIQFKNIFEQIQDIKTQLFIWN